MYILFFSVTPIQRSNIVGNENISIKLFGNHLTLIFYTGRPTERTKGKANTLIPLQIDNNADKKQRQKGKEKKGGIKEKNLKEECKNGCCTAALSKQILLAQGYFANFKFIKGDVDDFEVTVLTRKKRQVLCCFLRLY